ncbi:exodeoxyribonuclease VII large subunit [Flammeovirgaceae bacterium SG7u.111]|nr:exodeoxyribonuclease VII large subunit [Flammeovirgaceae bacterium SG7u.132]WPO37706.1 exodeoxyribonuclease VII large subunit [Flammeovirgaceae bacterium SG7u.111]
MKHFTLLQLNKSIQKLIVDINRQFWISAELAQAQVGTHAYLELVQKEDERIVAKARANIWGSKLAQLHAEHGAGLEVLLSAGSKVLILVEVTYHEVHGLSLNVQDINPAYTIGELELKRRETIWQLIDNELMDKQQGLPLPLVAQRIAVVSSPTAAGYSDFLNQLHQNPYGYKFQLETFQASVQGERAEQEIIIALKRIDPSRFDAVALIRGGGARLDLEVFNSYALSETIANLELPVFTGIGHHRDESVCDMVARQQLKTPTAVAEFFVQLCINFESQLQLGFENIAALTKDLLNTESRMLDSASFQLQSGVLQLLYMQKVALGEIKMKTAQQAQLLLEREKVRIKSLGQEIHHLNPENILKRGYSISYVNGKPVKTASELKKGEELTTLTHQFEIKSTIDKVEKRDEQKEN